MNRSNYEIWLIDFLDGNLNDLQVEQLRIFLNENPDLKEEFEELTPVSLQPTERHFSKKELLKKSSKELTGSQFEYLCIAYMENDLSKDQIAELFEIIEREPDKRGIFELIQKTRLAPAGIGYKYKNQLLRRTRLQKVIRLSVIGLSAAASVTILVMTYFLYTGNLSDDPGTEAQNTVIDTTLQKPVFDIIQGSKITEKEPVLFNLQKEKIVSLVENNGIAAVYSDSAIKLPAERLNIIIENQEPGFKKIPVYAEIKINTGIIRNMLVASNSGFKIQPYDDERSNVSRFFARTFRDKILNEPVSKDAPLKGYEIAEAGITGLNKLFGWEMALDERNDENGELRSVYFSSKILKFNAPVKKTEPLP